MADNIGGQLCRVNNMTNAWDRIREECDHFDSAVGLMAETCYMGLRNSAFEEMFTVPGCDIPTANLKQSGIDIELQIVGTNAFNFDIILQFPRDSFHYGSDQLDDEDKIVDGIHERTFSFDVDVSEGDFVEIIVINQETGEEIGRESVRFTFDRKDKWSVTRHVNIGLFDRNDIVFDGWD